MHFFKKHKLAVITLAYWFLLIFIVAAWVWWYISLQKQNNEMFLYKTERLDKNDIAYAKNSEQINNEHKLKTAQFISEGITFLLVTLVGAVFVYRATRRQILLSRQQQNFMMAITHELKTPIAVAKLNLETMQKRKLEDAQQQKLISNTLQETNRLNELTNNILVASQLEARAYNINMQRLDLSTLVKNCVKDFAGRVQQREIENNIDDGVFMEGEELLLQMLVNNLLDNALKYSPKEFPVKIALKKQGHKTELRITDEGNGIAANEKKKIFDKFYRSGSETTRTAKGTGLGLYLCKKIVLDHNGKITVADNHPKGSIFTVIFFAA